ncbi:MAG: hypothetical protein M5U15_00285 [Kiritimatiellae bacterium]|nr:hypothetical protein [Kiritimatiellia bacterium]
MKYIPALCLTALLFGAPLAFSQEEAKATDKSDAADIAAVLARLDKIEDKLAELTRSIDSISKFLGDRRSSAYETVDQRLDEMKRALDNTERSTDDIRRDVNRLR